MSNKHLVLGMMLVSVSLSTCAYDGDLSDNEQKDLVVRFFDPITTEVRNWYNGTNEQNLVQQPSVAVQSEPAAEQAPVVKTEEVVIQSEHVNVSVNVPEVEQAAPVQLHQGNQEPEQTQSQEAKQDQVYVEKNPASASVDKTALFGGLRDRIASIEINKETLLKYGAGALIAVTIGCITYVLYKNGSLQKFGTAIKNDPLVSTVVVVELALFAYLMYAENGVYVEEPLNS